LADPFHSAPGVEEFHVRPEFHVNGVGMVNHGPRQSPCAFDIPNASEAVANPSVISVFSGVNMNGTTEGTERHGGFIPRGIRFCE
jgi:hypothetical protein